MSNQKSILIIGKPGSSKTTFLSQFVTIARKNNSVVKFWKNPENIQPIQDAMARLRKGIETQSTPADSSLVINLPVSLNGVELELRCPDYGGEQINTILDQREIDEQWSSLILESNSWILFLRPHSIAFTYDLSNKSISELGAEVPIDYSPVFRISEQTSIIELLQIMLAVKKTSFQRQITSPKLVLALTCWDELTEVLTPRDYLEQHIPLLNQFLKTNWSAQFIKVIGVSAQGFDLKTQDNKDKYLDEGPESFPFVVTENSTERIFDLTRVISEAL